MALSPSEPSARTSRPKRSERHKLLTAIGAVVGLIVIWLLVIIFYDIGPPEDHDQLPHFTGSQNNPLAALQTWLEDHPPSSEDEFDRQKLIRDKPDEAELNALLAANHEALSRFNTLLQSDPTSWRWKTTLAFSASDRDETADHLWTLARIHAMQGRLQLAQHQDAQALRTARDLLKFGSGLRGAQGVISQLSICFATDEKTYNFLGAILGNYSWDQATLTDLLQHLQQNAPTAADVRLALAAQYLALKGSDLDGYITSGIGWSKSEPWVQQLRKFEYKKNRTLSQYLQEEQLWHSALDQGWTALTSRNDQFRKATDQTVVVVKILLSGNALGYAMCLNTNEIISYLMRSYFNTLALNRVCQLEIQLRLYELQQGRLPSSLSELQTASPGSVPIDPFSPKGKPLRWSTTSSKIYSIGDGGIDNDDASENHNNIGLPYWWKDRPPAPSTTR